MSAEAEHVRPRVLVTDKIAAEGLRLLDSVADVDQRVGLDPAELVTVISGYDALIVRSETKVTADVIRAGLHLRVIARAGVGVDNIDVAAATNSGVIVVNSPTGNVGAAAEHTIAMLLALARQIPDAVASLRAGKWERSRFVGVEVRGKTLGVIGLGKVGLGVARSAMGMGMRVTAMDPYVSPDFAEQMGIELADLDSVLSKADFLTAHTPLTPATKNVISAEQFQKMPRGSFVLNVARGGVVDEAALLAALESGHIAGAALDVFTVEPPTADEIGKKLLAHPKVIATPHLGASTKEAQITVAIDVCEQTAEILQGGAPRAAVNAPLILPEDLAKLRPFVALVEKLGLFYRQWYRKQSRRFEITYDGEVAEGDTYPLRVALIKGLTETISEDRVNFVSANTVAKRHGIEITERKSNSPQQYANLITLRGLDGSDEQILSGAVTWGQERVVRVDGYTTDFAPSGAILLCKNQDRPGMVGKVGVILGDAGVNINSMNVGPLNLGAGPQGEALMILSVDREISAAALSAVKNTDGISDVITAHFS